MSTSSTSSTTSSVIPSVSSTGAISSLGIASNGIDTQSIVTKLVAAESVPITQLQTQATGIQTKISDWGTIKSAMASLQDAANALVDPSTWTARTVSSNNSAAVTATATAGALAGNFNVTVNQLAESQTNESAGVATGTALGSAGTLSIQIGTWSGTSFTAGSAASVSVTVKATDTLSTIASSINAAGAGVSASVVTSNGQDRLVLRGTNTGAAAGFQITGTDSTGAAITGSTGLGQLTYQSNAAGTATTGLTLAENAQDASATVDGINVTSTNNTITGAVAGLTLNLLQTTTGSAQVSVTNDTTTPTTAINTFVTNYNSLVSTIKGLTAYDPSTKTAADLQGDSSALGILSSLSRIVQNQGPSGNTYKNLSALGIQVQLDGSLAVNSTTLSSAMNSSISTVQQFFAAASSSTSNGGLAQQFGSYGLSVNDTNGTLTNRTNSLQAQLKNKNNAITQMQAQVTAYQARLVAQYTALDSKLATLNATNSYITQQVAQWNKTSG